MCSSFHFHSIALVRALYSSRLSRGLLAVRPSTLSIPRTAHKPHCTCCGTYAARFTTQKFSHGRFAARIFICAQWTVCFCVCMCAKVGPHMACRACLVASTCGFGLLHAMMMWCFIDDACISAAIAHPNPIADASATLAKLIRSGIWIYSHKHMCHVYSVRSLLSLINWWYDQRAEPSRTIPAIRPIRRQQRTHKKRRNDAFCVAPCISRSHCNANDGFIVRLAGALVRKKATHTHNWHIDYVANRTTTRTTTTKSVMPYCADPLRHDTKVVWIVRWAEATHIEP